MGHVIITGGSSGIGLEIARVYLAQGNNVSLFARRADVLNSASTELAQLDPMLQSRVHIAAVDVCSEGSIAAATLEAEAIHGPCDVLVTSAGRVDPCFFNEQASGDFFAQLETNFLGTVHAVRAVLPQMMVRRQGNIVLISSGAALIGIPGYSAYCASKSALSGFAEALFQEVRSSGVSVSIAFPPDTLTPQYERELPLRPVAAQKLMGRLSPWSAKIVARRIVEGAHRQRREIQFGFSLTMLSMFGRLIKPFLFHRPARIREKLVK